MAKVILTARPLSDRKVAYYDTLTKTVGIDYYYNTYHNIYDSTYSWIVLGREWNTEYNVPENDEVDIYFPATYIRFQGSIVDQYCTGKTLTVVKMPIMFSWPMSTSDMDVTVTANSPTCTFIINDINITGISQEVSGPDVIAQINAIGTNTPFTYSLNGVDYQSSSQFTISTSGLYMAYVMDSLGFIASETFEVDLDPYGLIYYDSFYNDLGELINVNIYKLNYDGPTSQVRLGGNPVTIKYLKEGDSKYEPIKGNECVITMNSDSNFEFVDMFVSEDRAYKLEVLNGSTILFYGYISPEVWNEPYTDPSYEVDVTFLDGLGLLKKRDFVTPTGDNFTSIKSHLEVIKICLLQTGMGLPINTCINIYESAMLSDTNDDPLTQAYVNTNAFISDKGVPNNCYDVLSSILNTYGARIWLENGEWNIVNVDELYTTYARRKYNSHGVFLGTDTYNPNVTLTGTGSSPVKCFVGGNQNLEISPAYKSFTVELNFIKLNSFNCIQNNDFSQLGTGGQVFKYWTDNYGILSNSTVARISGDGDANVWTKFIYPTPVYIVTNNSGIQLNLKTKFKVITSVDNLTDVEVKFKVKVGARWMDENGDWQVVETFIIKKVSPNTYIDLDITSFFVPYSGYLECEIYQAKVFDIGYDAIALDIEYFSVNYIENLTAVPDSKLYTKVNEGNYIEKPSNKKVLFGDFPEYSTSGVLLANTIYIDPSASQYSQNWYRKGIDESRQILDLLSDRILNNYKTPTQVIKGSLYGSFVFGNVISDPNNPGKEFMINSMEIDVQKCEHKVELVELVTLSNSTNYRLLENGEQRIIENTNYITLE